MKRLKQILDASVGGFDHAQAPCFGQATLAPVLVANITIPGELCSSGKKGCRISGCLLAVLLGARTLLGAPGLTTRNKKLLGAKGIATRNKKLPKEGIVALMRICSTGSMTRCWR